MKVIIACRGSLPQSAEIIQRRFGSEIVTLSELQTKELNNYDYVIVVDDVHIIRVSRVQVSVKTCVIAIMRSEKDFGKAWEARASAVFGPKGTKAASYLTERGTPAPLRTERQPFHRVYADGR